MSTPDTESATLSSPSAPPAVDATAFRQCMSRVAAAVHIVTTDGVDEESEDSGITATAVCAVCDTPPCVLVCLNRRSRAHDRILASGHLAINALAAHQRHLADAFSGQGGLSMPERFALGRWRRLVTGAPVLEGASAVFDCDIERSECVGTHRLFVCSVRAVRVGDAVAALIHGNRRFDAFSFEAS